MIGLWDSSSVMKGSSIMAEEKPRVSVKNSGGVNIVEFADRKILEELSIAEIGEELAKVVTGTNDVKMLLSFKNVEHLSSAALGMLISLNKQVAQKKGKLKLSDITPQIYEVFEITKLDKLFTILQDEQAALQAF